MIRIVPMKTLLLLSVIVATAARVVLAGDPVNVRFDRQGLRSLSHGRSELLKDSRPRVNRVQWQSGEVEPVPGSFVPEMTYDEKAHRLEQTWSMGKLVCVYQPQDDKLGISITFTNTSDRPLSSVDISAMTVVFPDTPTGTGWYEALHTTSEGIDDAAAVVANYAGGTLAVVGESFDPEVRLGLDSAHDKERRAYHVSLSPVRREARDLMNADPVLLEPRESITFDITLRFGPEKSSLHDLAGDAFTRYAELFPRVLKWDDRRPIAMLMLASSAAQHRSAMNPRGWLSDPKLDASTTNGQPLFRKRILDWADRSVTVSKAIGAQGIIVWDVEGEEFQPLVYVGDPRKLPELAPEFDEIVDEFFKRFSRAGLKTGVCIRPSRIVRNRDPDPKLPWRHEHMRFDPVEEMADKIAYAKERWGCTLFYIDTNVTLAYAGEKESDGSDKVTSWMIRADAMRRLAERHPDVLIIPEFQYTGYYSHVSGYRELRGGQAATPARVLAAYPDAFSVINVSDGKMKERKADLIAAVKRGDILMYRGWFKSPEAEMVRYLYREARR